MVVLKPDEDTPFGQCIPPQSNYAITTNLRGWATAIKIREGDRSVLQRVTHIYPRFMPMRSARELIGKISAKLNMPPTHGALAFTCPTAFAMVRDYACSESKPEHRLDEADLTYKCVDVGGTRLYLIYYPMEKTPGIIEGWQNPGTGISIRFAETLLPHVETLEEVECDGYDPPSTSYLPEGPSHAKLRERISGLLHRAAIDPDKVRVTPGDVFLFNTGMATIYRLHDQLQAYKPGTTVAVGILFHNTLHHFAQKSPRGFRHFGPVDEAGIGVFEAWLAGEKAEGRSVSYVFVEIPSNPLLASLDLRRLKALATTYDFILVVDDTVGSFANIDVLPLSDVLVTSLTKSFSGYADVMAGSLVLNPLSRYYAELRPLNDREFRQELAVADADVLLANSEDYLARQQVLNRNAAAMADYLQRFAADPASPVTRVLYPTVLPDLANLRALLRRPSPDFPEPGYGCLLSVDFEDVDTAIAFYDTLGFYPGPHLGAHRTLSCCFNALAYTKHEEEAARYRAFGLLEESIRISAGLEAEEDLLDTLKEALDAAAAAKAKKAAAAAAAAA